GTGEYGMTLNFGTGASPTVATPNTQSPNGNPLNGGGGVGNRTDANGATVSSLLTSVGDLTDRLGLGIFGNLLGGLNMPLSNNGDVNCGDWRTAGNYRRDFGRSVASKGPGPSDQPELRAVLDAALAIPPQLVSITDIQTPLLPSGANLGLTLTVGSEPQQ